MQEDAKSSSARYPLNAGVEVHDTKMEYNAGLYEAIRPRVRFFRQSRTCPFVNFMSNEKHEILKIDESMFVMQSAFSLHLLQKADIII